MLPTAEQLSYTLLITIVILCSSSSSSLSRAENIDFVIERYCYPSPPPSPSPSLPSSRQQCECNSENAALLGVPTLTIDCSFKELKVKDFTEVLPLYTTALDLSWNALDKVPLFACDSLRMLNLMHNNITSLTSKNFVKISNLHELYLSWNSIQSIEWNSFDDLVHLRVLDLSHNNLHSLSLQIFKPMIVLESLNLSWNRQLNQTDGIQERDFYQTYGVNGNLRVLNVEACSLVNISLPVRAPLEVLNLRRNSLVRVPRRLPNSLKKLDISENLMESLRPMDTANLTLVREFLAEDMIRLASVEQDAFGNMQALEKLSFQNSRYLSSIDANAFGVNATKFPPLKTITFRGTKLRGFNSTLAPVFRQLTELDLNGLPIHCDCELIWIKQEVKVETNGRCYQPSKLRGMLVSSAHASDFSCNPWPEWLYWLTILALIMLCSLGIYFIVVGLRPHNGVALRRKIGAGSPYARVTIEPNRPEIVSK